MSVAPLNGILMLDSLPTAVSEGVQRCVRHAIYDAVAPPAPPVGYLLACRARGR